jgi:hypothetical protein
MKIQIAGSRYVYNLAQRASIIAALTDAAY